MSSKARRYRDYAWVVTMAPIKCPMRNASADNFPRKDFAFFVEEGFFCIEYRRTGAVVDVSPSNIREARRLTEREIEAENEAKRKAELELEEQKEAAKQAEA